MKVAFFVLLFLAGLGFGYAVYQRYTAPTLETSVPKRVWSAVVGAAVAVGAAFSLIFGQSPQ